MSDIEKAVSAAREIEALLADRFGAEGRGLHARLTSVEHLIPGHIVQRARFIASVRNSVVHEQGATIRDSFGFENARAEVVDWLTHADPPRRLPRLLVEIGHSLRRVLVAIVAVVVILYFMLKAMGGGLAWVTFERADDPGASSGIEFRGSD